MESVRRHVVLVKVGRARPVKASGGALYRKNAFDPTRRRTGVKGIRISVENSNVSAPSRSIHLCSQCWKDSSTRIVTNDVTDNELNDNERNKSGRDRYYARKTRANDDLSIFIPVSFFARSRTTRFS